MMNTALQDQLVHILNHEFGNEIGLAKMQINQLRHNQDDNTREDSLNKLLACLNRFDEARRSLKEPLEIKQYLPVSDVVPINFTQIIQESVDERNIVSGFPIDLKITPKDKPFTLAGDYELCARLIGKLLDSAKHLNKAAKPVLINLVNQQYAVELSLKITGNWPEFNINRLFEQLGIITKDNPYDCDLYIAKLIVNHYGGRIEATVNDKTLEIKMILPN